MEFEYHVETGPDGIRWVSVEPLLNDIVKSIDALMKIDLESLDDNGKEILNLKILGLKTVHEFLGSIITADNLKKMKTNMSNNDGQEKEKLH
jgi:hypothetical protein